METIVIQLHPDLQPLYERFNQGHRQFGYLGTEGLRGLPGLSEDPTKEQIALLNTANRANQLICNKNYLKTQLVDQLNKGYIPDWSVVNQEYTQIAQELFTLDCQLQLQNTRPVTFCE